MSVMRSTPENGIFLIYDLGGGTLDIAVAESISGRVHLLAHGGIAMCGGRDFDRTIANQIVRPWLEEHFTLPDNFITHADYKLLRRMAEWAIERAKIELSSRTETIITLAETEARTKDKKGSEIYLDIPLHRNTYDQIISAQIAESIQAVRETLSSVGLSPQDLDRIVFIGGPTHYKPLRDKISFELGIPGNADVNPMTAVAEGASVFAESIDWSSRNHARKTPRGQIAASSELDLQFNYIARTPAMRAKIAIQLGSTPAAGHEIQIDSPQTGWSSGRLSLEHGKTLDVLLVKNGDNIFKISAYTPEGTPVKLQQDTITITKTAATIDAIPASHSIFVEVLDRVGGKPTIDYLIRAGDTLPKKGSKTFKAAQSLQAGAAASLNFKLWEGDIETPIEDNRPIGVLKISGADFDYGTIPAGATLECEYEILDSGNIILEVSVPSISGIFHSGKNFYSRQEGQLDHANSSELIIDEGQKTLERIARINRAIQSPELDQARKKLQSVVTLSPEGAEPETNQEAMEKILSARKTLNQVRKQHLKQIRQLDLDNLTDLFNDHLKTHARPSEASSFNTLAQTAQRSIDRNDNDFEYHLHQLNITAFGILWRLDWFIIEQFNSLQASSPRLYADKQRSAELIRRGKQYLKDNDIEKLRSIIMELSTIRIGSADGLDMTQAVNILRG